MSGQTTHHSEKQYVPIGVVLVVIGFIVLMTVGAVWVIVPVYMPQSLYDLVGEYLPETAVSYSANPLPTLAAVAASNDPVALLPDTSASAAEDGLPAYFVSTENAARREPGVGEPNRIVIPAIHLDAAVSSVSLEKYVDGDQIYYQWPVPNAFMAGWHENSARLGEVGNTVLNGHHNIHGEVFGELIDLKIEDQIILFDSKRPFTYRVTDIETLLENGQPMSVRMENAQWIAPTSDERITLITCWPYTGNSHRLIVVAKPLQESGVTAVTQ